MNKNENVVVSAMKKIETEVAPAMEHNKTELDNVIEGIENEIAPAFEDHDAVVSHVEENETHVMSTATDENAAEEPQGASYFEEAINNGSKLITMNH